ncbi:hypothetical protein MAR_000641 [Mya arenaria]|uniref:Uncharacterized protein n=1 Tax=Mya arenaria TaxID=6604 RepID=A0ABY7FDL0_MYAAR|nr:hypothetical protein MAR_000641 [Mya arenaria]
MYDEALKSVKAAESAYVNRATVLELLDKLRESCKKSNRRFDFTTLNNEEYVDLTGLTKAAFEDIAIVLKDTSAITRSEMSTRLSF